MRRLRSYFLPAAALMMSGCSWCMQLNPCQPSCGLGPPSLATCDRSPCANGLVGYPPAQPVTLEPAGVPPAVPPKVIDAVPEPVSAPVRETSGWRPAY